MTPIRRQYLEIKKRYPHAVVFFRLGDFYETFDDDARLVARELEITLTSKPMGKNLRVPLAGFPYHALDGHLARLLGRGFKVAICEQMEDPKQAKGIVAREVVRLVTPGTISEASLLPERANNYLAALKIGDQGRCGLACLDVSTGEFIACEVAESDLHSELSRLSPAEILVPAGDGATHGFTCSPVPRESFEAERAAELLLEHFAVSTLAGFGCESSPLITGASGALIAYARENQRGALGHIQPLRVYSLDQFMAVDGTALRNLEVVESSRAGGASLLLVLDRTRTRMGARLLRTWLRRPLLSLEAIDARLECVGALHGDLILRSDLQARLKSIPDLERLAVRCSAGQASPRELGALRDALSGLPKLMAVLADDGLATELKALSAKLNPHEELASVLAASLNDELPLDLEKGDVIRQGFSAELDELRRNSTGARQRLAELETRERVASGIKSLKLGYNRVFGYYLEVTSANIVNVPEGWQRRQTLTGGERYITPELKELEDQILNARERNEALERDIFKGLCATAGAYAATLIASARVLAEIDVYCGLAEVAAERGYARPQLDDSLVLEIRDGRHPVVEAALADRRFVGNDLALDEETQVVILTGPNMGGKSTYLRQVALIALMAQAGSFVPAASARIGLVDRLHARVGAQDDLAAGQSTFMVEMVETAAMLNQAGPRSLLVFDEIGRGTSTYDGISIARAVVEHLHEHPARARTLFATHYHELTDLAATHPRVRNFHVAVAEDGEEVVFLHRILPGRADRSYGIHVARLAGLPPLLLGRAREIQAELELSRGAHGKPSNGHQPQLPLLADVPPSPLLRELAGLDVDHLTPLDALLKLNEMRARAEITLGQ